VIGMEVAIPGPGTFSVEVVGASRRQHVLAQAVADKGRGAIVEASLVLEDSNPHDANAVAVHLNGQLCGYLRRADAEIYRANLAAAGDARLTVRCKAKIVGGFETESGERASYGLRLDLPPLDAPA